MINDHNNERRRFLHVAIQISGFTYELDLMTFVLRRFLGHSFYLDLFCILLYMICITVTILNNYFSCEVILISIFQSSISFIDVAFMVYIFMFKDIIGFCIY